MLSLWGPMHLATMPLDRVPVVSLDLETTGLHASVDHIVQIGAIQSQEELARFAALVRPGVPIPAASTRIHGITDEMLVDVDDLPLVMPRLRAHVRGCLILGYNIGFDLALLDAEAARQGLDWGWNGALCLRQLATCLLEPETMMMLGESGVATCRDTARPVDLAPYRGALRRRPCRRPCRA